MNKRDVKTFIFDDDGKIPNNQKLPVILYPEVLKDRSADMEQHFNKHNWLNSWANGVLDQHHYHSNAHEVLGVISGSALLQLGGEHGKQTEVTAGDVIVLPAGTGHKRIRASSDFKIAGAYPDGMEYDMRKGNPEDRPEVLQNIKDVPLPDQDPVFGEDGPLIELWK